MCRLYGFIANEPTRIECSLIRAQNALMTQSKLDREGLTHGHGWGVAGYPDGVPFVHKQAWAAYHGEHFQTVAARVYTHAAIAHVRRATVGAPAPENTHPFAYGRWLFAHNGTVPNFDAIRGRLLDDMDPLHRDEIHGTTDSEHVFRYLMSLWMHDPKPELRTILRGGIETIVRWSREIDPGAVVSLNTLWTDGEHLAGSRFNRTLWYLEREGVTTCDLCNRPHVHHNPKRAYRAVEVASEPITDENWLGVPNGTVFSVDPDIRIHFDTLSADALPRDVEAVST